VTRRPLWDEDIMLRSKALLETLKAQGLDFVLIGGWAVYMLSRYHMSRNIDVLMRDRELWKLRSLVSSRRGHEKAPGLRKMGFIIDDVGLDIYTETQSGLPVDIKEVFEERRFVEIDGYKVLEPARLLLLKLQAASSRGQGHKGVKDRCDIMSICLKDKKYLEGFMALVMSSKDETSLEAMRRIIKDSDIEFEYVFGEKVIPGKMRRLKKGLLDVLK
jgi:hypothetical protein